MAGNVTWKLFLVLTSPIISVEWVLLLVADLWLRIETPSLGPDCRRCIHQQKEDTGIYINSIGVYHSSDTQKPAENCMPGVCNSIPKDFGNHHFDGVHHILPFCNDQQSPVCQWDSYSTCGDVARLLLQLPQRCDC